MSAHTLHRAPRRYSVNDTPVASSVVDALVTDWANRVVINGGAAVSLNTQIAMSVFVEALASANVFHKILTMAPLVPDSLAAAFTPIPWRSGSDPWTNFNFVLADLTVNGLIGNGSSKYLNSGCVPFSNMLQQSSAGLVKYIFTYDNTTTQDDLSCYGSANSSEFGLTTDATNSYFACWRFINTGTDIVQATTPTPAAGYYSGQRTGNSTSTLYFANSTTAHASIGTATTPQTGTIEQVQPLFGLAGNVLGAPSNYSKKRISFLAITQGLTSTEDANMYAAVQAFRQNLGGGFV